MEASIARWGNSLGVRIPKEIAGKLGFREGTRVEIEAKGDRVVIAAVRSRPRYALEDLLVDTIPAEMREAFDWGPDVGRE
jgi:antitoxin MazE